MLKIMMLFVLLVTSMAIPPLLLVSLPLTFLWVRGVLIRRRLILTTVERAAAKRQNDRVVKFFR